MSDVSDLPPETKIIAAHVPATPAVQNPLAIGIFRSIMSGRER